MAKIRFVLVLTLLLLVSVSAFAVGSVKTVWYSNSSFTTVVGAKYLPAYDCPEWDLWWQWGSTSAYKKIHTFTECDEGGTETVRCYYNGGSIPCP